MKLRTDVDAVRDAALAYYQRLGAEAPRIAEAIIELSKDVSRVQELVDTLLAYHREYHTETSPRFCALPCQLAAAL